jgi:glyoxylase-like metal-dependent hydrolase (beta-lactamase superfamily II)
MKYSGGALLDSLAAQGVAADEVTDVVYTHLHGDHIGWASDEGTVVFANAVHRCHRLDWEHFVGTDELATEKLTPVVPLLELFDADVTIAPGVDVQLAPGHTPGSVLVVLSSGSARALLVGDVVHCPVELVDDEWGALADVDPALALKTRVALARELEGTDTPIGAAHFPGLAFGRLLAGEGRRQWTAP